MSAIVGVLPARNGVLANSASITLSKVLLACMAAMSARIASIRVMLAGAESTR